MVEKSSGRREPDDNDDLLVYDVFVIPRKDGTFEWRIKSSDGRNWMCYGYATEDEASAGAMQYCQLHLFQGVRYE